MRGDVHRYHAKGARGHEQAGTRYAVVVQSDDLPLSTWLVVPTSTGQLPGPIRPEVEIDGKPTRVLTDHLTSVDPQARLGACVGRLSVAEMQAIDEALRIILDLE